MKKNILITIALASFASTMLAADSGQEQLAASIRKAREEASSTAQQLNTTLSTLNTLVFDTKGDLTTAYKDFEAQIPNTKAAAETTRARLAKMTEEKGKYFGAWEQTINSINNKSLQSKAKKRMESADKSYSRIESALTEAGEKFRPFLSDLADVQKVLSHDVTKNGIKSVKGTVRDANFNYKSVSNAINDALKEMQKMEKALSSQT